MSEYSDPEVYDESEEGGEEEDGKEEFEDSELRPADESHVVAYGASGKESEEEDLSHLVDELKASWDGDSDNDYGDVLEPVRGLNLIKWQIFDNLDALDSMPEAEVTPEIEGSQRHLESVLRVLSQEFPTEYLTYQLSHHYEESPLTLDGLRGKDRRRTQHLLQACDKVGLCLYLARIRRTIHSTFSRTKGSSAGSVPPELTKIFRDEIEISGAYEMGGLQVAESMDFKKGWLIQRTLIDRSPVFARTRSQLRMATTTHERTALIIVPESNRLLFMAEAVRGGYLKTARSLYDQVLKNPSNHASKRDFELFCEYICDAYRIHDDYELEPEPISTSIVEASLHLGLPGLFKSAIEMRQSGLPPRIFRLLGKMMCSVGIHDWEFKDEAAAAFRTKNNLHGRLDSLKITVNAYSDYREGIREKRSIDAIFRDAESFEEEREEWEEEWGEKWEGTDSDGNSEDSFEEESSPADWTWPKTPKVDRRGQFAETKGWEITMIRECLDSPCNVKESDVKRLIDLMDRYSDKKFLTSIIYGLQNRDFPSDIKADFLIQLVSLPNMSEGYLDLAFETICPFLLESYDPKTGQLLELPGDFRRLGFVNILNFDTHQLDTLLKGCERRKLRTCTSHLCSTLSSYISPYPHRLFWPHYIDFFVSRTTFLDITALADLYAPLYQRILTRYVYEYVGPEPLLASIDGPNDEWKEWKTRQDRGKRLFEVFGQDLEVVLRGKYDVLSNMNALQLVEYEKTAATLEDSEDVMVGSRFLSRPTTAPPPVLNMNGKRRALGEDLAYGKQRRM